MSLKNLKLVINAVIKQLRDAGRNYTRYEKILSDQKTKLGEGILVEVDESKFGPRKYNRGRIVGGVWLNERRFDVH